MHTRRYVDVEDVWAENLRGALGAGDGGNGLITIMEFMLDEVTVNLVRGRLGSWRGWVVQSNFARAPHIR